MPLIDLKYLLILIKVWEKKSRMVAFTFVVYLHNRGRITKYQYNPRKKHEFRHAVQQ